jgi:phosphoserine aminotransferase
MQTIMQSSSSSSFVRSEKSAIVGFRKSLNAKKMLTSNANEKDIIVSNDRNHGRRRSSARARLLCEAMVGGGHRKYNFSAGPAMLPLDVLEEAQKDLVDYKGTGMSVLEMSHRGKDFMAIAEKAEKDLRELVKIPDNYKVLFVQGGASTMFAMNVMNLCPNGTEKADFVTTGAWSKKAFQEAKRYCDASEAATSKDANFSTIPERASWNLREGAKFVHICENETIGGVEFKETPKIQDGAVLVADHSSNYLSKPIDVSKYGIVYGGVQKNIACAGMGIYMVREDLIGNPSKITPTMMDFKTHSENESMYNTPPCYTWYISGLVFAKLLKDGGLEAMEKRNQEKAKILYDAIDASAGYYNCPTDSKYRSLMNVPFTLAKGGDVEKKFLKEASDAGFESLKGHRSVGGARASIYNAMPKEGVQALASFMKDFQLKNA